MTPSGTATPTALLSAHSTRTPPSILKEIQMTIENGHKHGCWGGICGELGADLELTEKFVEMGIDELSVSPSRILALRDKIRSIE